jgi:hypothetical protein
MAASVLELDMEQRSELLTIIEFILR